MVKKKRRLRHKNKQPKFVQTGKNKTAGGYSNNKRIVRKKLKNTFRNMARSGAVHPLKFGEIRRKLGFRPKSGIHKAKERVFGIHFGEMG